MLNLYCEDVSGGSNFKSWSIHNLDAKNLCCTVVVSTLLPSATVWYATVLFPHTQGNSQEFE